MAVLGGWGVYLSYLPNWRELELPVLHGLILVTAVVFWLHWQLGEGRAKRAIQWLCLGLALACASTMVGQSYRDNARLFFYLGLTACVALFILVKQWLGPWAPGADLPQHMILFAWPSLASTW